MTKLDLDKLLKLQKSCKREQNKIWEKMHREIVSIIARFTWSISEPNENNDEGADEIVSEPKVKKPRGTPAKRKLLQSNNMLNYVTKSPQLVSEHQQPQQQDEGSNGSNIKVNPNQAKQNLFQ